MMSAAWMLIILLASQLASAKLTENRLQSKELQRALGHDDLVLVIGGVLDRIIGEPSPDPLILINFPDINTQFKVHVLEDSRKIKITLAMDDGELTSIIFWRHKLSEARHYQYWQPNSNLSPVSQLLRLVFREIFTKTLKISVVKAANIFVFVKN